MLHPFEHFGQLQRMVQGGDSHTDRRPVLSVQVTKAAESKTIVFDNDSRARLQNGINKVADAVGVTLGPRGEMAVPRL